MVLTVGVWMLRVKTAKGSLLFRFGRNLSLRLSGLSVYSGFEILTMGCNNLGMLYEVRIR